MPSKNKVDQLMRRQARKFVVQQYTVLNEVINPKPWFIPLWAWAWGARIFIDTVKLRKFMEEGIDPKAVRQSTEQK